MSNRQKNVLITGGSAGIGKATAIAMARKGFKVYITGRDKEKTAMAVKEIQQASQNPEVFYFLADMSKMKEVRQLAAEVNAGLDHLDVLINNAGGVNSKRELTEDGYEKTFATNHLAYFLLTGLLLDLLKKSSPARIVNVSSNSHYNGKINLNDLQMEKKYFIMQAYANSKLCNVLFTYELARKLEGTGITVNSLHPGVVNTNIGKKNTGFFADFVWTAIARLRGISIEKGAATSVYLATANELENVTGKYFDNCREKKSSALSYNKDLAEKLWNISAGMTGINQ